MAIPSQTLTIRDPGLGIVEPSASAPLCIGTCGGGTAAANTVQVVNSHQQAIDLFGYGPLSSTLAHIISIAGGPIPAIKSAGSVAATTSAVTQTGAGPTISITGTARGTYAGKIEIVAGGAVGTATFKYSLDGGVTYGPVRATASTYNTVKSGLTLNFAAGTYVAGEIYSFTTTAPHLNATDLQAAMAVARATGESYAFPVICGDAADATAGATLFGALASEMTSLSNVFRYKGALMSSGVDTASAVKTAFAASADTRIGVAFGTSTRSEALGMEGHGMPTLPLVDSVAARAASVLVSTDLKRVPSGPLVGVTAVSHDEFANNQGLNDAGFITARTWPDYAGYYITQGNIKAPAGSDYQRWHTRRVMDLAMTEVYRAQSLLMGTSVRTVADPVGAIDPRDAAQIEAQVLAKLQSVLLAPVSEEGTKGHVSDVRYVIDRTTNVLATETITSTLSIRPRGYASFISTQVGMVAA